MSDFLSRVYDVLFFFFNIMYENCLKKLKHIILIKKKMFL